MLFQGQQLSYLNIREWVLGRASSSKQIVDIWDVWKCTSSALRGWPPPLLTVSLLAKKDVKRSHVSQNVRENKYLHILYLLSRSWVSIISVVLLTIAGGIVWGNLRYRHHVEHHQGRKEKICISNQYQCKYYITW